MKNTATFRTKEYIFWLQNSRKGKYNSHQPHKKHKKLTSPGREPPSPVRENISPVREDQSPMRVTSKIGKKQQGESTDSEKVNS